MRSAVQHTLTNIEQYVRDKICLFFILLEMKFVSASENFPVDMTQVVSWNILTMLGKLDRKTMVGTSMRTGYVTLNDLSGPQLQAF